MVHSRNILRLPSKSCVNHDFRLFLRSCVGQGPLVPEHSLHNGGVSSHFSPAVAWPSFMLEVFKILSKHVGKVD